MRTRNSAPATRYLHATSTPRCRTVGAGCKALIEPAEWHRWHLSAKSSQTLAVGALGAATDLDPSLAWLTPVVGAIGAAPRVRFEHVVDAELLGEHPRQTAIDVLVETSDTVLAIEVKWTEQGLGACRCGANARAVSACAPVVRGRGAYWSAALACLDARYTPGAPCQVGLGYQAVRLFAAARALAGPDRRCAVLLIYDARNPYFGGAGAWPGWADALAQATDATTVPFVAVSWQALVGLLPRDESLEDWLANKHDLARRLGTA